ncbi:MAG: NAD(P)H-hydrate dehydratase [Polyangiaceae bacterium]
MKLVLSREQSQAFDQRAMNEHRVPGVLLMENAGRGAAELLLSLIESTSVRIIVVAGPGNNGGDGFVVARRLLVAGHSVAVYLLCDPSRLTGDAQVMYQAFIGVSGTVTPLTESEQVQDFEADLKSARVVVDAIFGTGLVRNVSGHVAQIVERINAADVFRYSLDLPSGLETDRGVVLGVAVRADVTVTFGHEKTGAFTTAGVEHVGELKVVDIGVPPLAREANGHTLEHLELEDLAPRFKRRSRASHKGRSGRIGLLAGHPGTTGAALLAARGALRMGAGLLTHLGLPESIAAIESRVLEAMTKRLEPNRLTASLIDAIHAMDALLIGPGLGLGVAQTELVDFVVEHTELPVVLDADALTLISGNLRRFRLAKGPRVLLPHRGEVARLLQISVADVDKDPLSALTLLTDLTHAVVVMKGAYTFVSAKGRKVAVVGEPCPAMATGGSGDVLAGAACALLVDHEPFDAALLAVHLHSRAGRFWSELHSADRGLLASELADLLPRAVAELAAD